MERFEAAVMEFMEALGSLPVVLGEAQEERLLVLVECVLTMRARAKARIELEIFWAGVMN
jgi:hypothetical protein